MLDLAPRSLLFVFSVGVTILLLFSGVQVLRFLFRDTAFAQSLAVPDVIDHIRNPFRAVVALSGMQMALFAIDTGDAEWAGYADHALNISLIAAIVWFLSASAFAGLISVVVGIAAQSTLGNVFAGIHLAFSNTLRVDDVIVIDGESGTVDDITLTTVIVHLWNDRRLILPSSHFLENGFENWTRSGARISGTVMLDLDWTAPLDEMRAELNRFLLASPLWDGRTGSLRVADATGGRLSIRIDISAADTLKLFGLSSSVRDAMVTYVVNHARYSLPRDRLEQVGEEDPSPGASRR